MNVYDFDKTIYSGDSSIDFYLFCLKKHKKIILLLPKQVWSFFKYKINIISKKDFKECFFSFVEVLDDIEQDVKTFWDSNIVKVKSWYLRQKQEDDLIISASPQFLLEDPLKRLGVNNLLCSKVDKYTGKLLGPNCYGEEKLKRYRAKYGNREIDEFYSDSLSDYSLADIAKSAYIVKGEKKINWSINKKVNKVRSK